MHQLIDQRVDQRVQRKDFPRIQLDVHRTLDVKENRDSYMAYVSL